MDNIGRTCDFMSQFQPGVVFSLIFITDLGFKILLMYKKFVNYAMELCPFIKIENYVLG